MNFAHTGPVPSQTLTRLTTVVLIHVGLGAALLLGTNTVKHFTLPPDEVVVDIPKLVPPPPPPPKPLEIKPKETPPLPDIVVPKEVIVVPDLPPSPLVTRVVDDIPTPPRELTPPGPPPPPAAPKETSNGGMRTAMLVDANACQAPDYPAAAARSGDTGTTTLALLVGVDGRVSDARIEQSSGSRELDRAARQALSKCLFKPATHNGLAEPSWGAIKYVWKLD